MSDKTTTTVKLAGKEVELKLTNRASFRLGTLKEEPTLKVPHKAYRDICCWVWAMLPKDLDNKFPEPDDLTEEITMDNLDTFTSAIITAMKEDSGEEGSVKKSKPSKRRRSASKLG